MKIGISTSTFFNTVAPEGAFDIMRNMCVDTTEVCLYTFSEYEKPYIDHFAAYKGGINVVAVSPMSTQFEPQLFSPNMRVRADAELIFKKVCYACFALGAKFYTFRGIINLGNIKNYDYSRLAQRYNQLADIAASYGVCLSLKNVRWAHSATPDFYKIIMPQCPRMFASFDMYNAESAGYDIREFLDVCPPQRISHLTVTDVIKGDWCLPGRGKYNFDRLFTELDRRKVQAPVLMSVRSDKYSDYLQVRDGYEWLCSCYNKVKV